MKINRQNLLANIVAFFQAESGVVVGDPGVGKSYLLIDMVDELLARQIPATMIRLDFLAEGTDAEIAQAFGLQGTDWITEMQRLTIPLESKGVLIFDGYDGIRDEKLKTAMLSQIARAKRELPGWSVVVSVRTYDAAKSPRLIDLFPQEYHPDDIHCRRFTIPPLSEAELEIFLRANPKLSIVYHQGNPKLKEALKIPFFLFLLDIILKKTDTSTNALTVLKSEIELLEMYWAKVVCRERPYILTELFLKRLTEKMVDDRVLSVDKLDYLSTESPENVMIAERLLSERVLAEQGNYTAKIGYAHNILFDYAVSRLVLKDNTAHLLSFITADPTRPFFLRSSFIYFFARLWYRDRVKFWQIYNELSQRNNPVVQLFNKLIPSIVIAREFDENTPLDFLNGTQAYKKEQVISVLQALRFLKAPTNVIAKASLIYKLSSNVQLEFVFDLLVLLDELIGTEQIKSDPGLFATCGQAARNLMDFLMSNRSNPQVDNIAARRGTPLVCKTYATDIIQSRSRLENILGMLAHPGFNITYFTMVADGVKEFYQSDPEFCVKVYTEIFDHEENSNETESMHAGVLLNFRFSRHDQYNNCRFSLQQFFPRLLDASPQLAIPLGLNITNRFIEKEHGGGMLVPEFIKTHLDFFVNEASAHYKIDMSHGWADYSIRGDSVRHTPLIITYLQSLIDSSRFEELKAGVELYISNANCAYNWKMLLELGASNPGALHHLLFDLLLQPIVLSWNDTVVEAGKFLESAVPFYNQEKLLQIEMAILTLPDYFANMPKGIRDEIDRKVLRLLSRIPLDRLRTERAINMITTTGTVGNDPIVTYTSFSEPYTTERFLEDRGVNIQSPVNENLLADNEKMESFCNEFRNSFPNRQRCEEPLAVAISVFGIVKVNEDLEPDLVRTLLINIAAICEIVLRSELNIQHQEPLENDQYAIIKEMILFCLQQHTESDTYAEQHFSPGNAYTPTPRSQAASALPLLFRLTGDAELLKQIRQYSNDKNAVVRFGIVQWLNLLYTAQKDVFWEIIGERMNEETDWFTKGAAIEKLIYTKIFSEEPDRLLAAIQVAKHDIFTITGKNNSFLEAFLKLTLSFIKDTGDVSMNDVLKECLDQNLVIANDLVFQAFKLIEPENIYRNYTDPADIKKSQRVVDLLMGLLGRCEQTLLSVLPGQGQSKEVEEAFRIMSGIVQRIYFSMQVNKEIIQSGRRQILPQDQQDFYFFIKPLLEKVINISKQLDGGFMLGQSAHHFIQIMGEALRYDPRFSLATTKDITVMAGRTQYTFDSAAVKELVKYAEVLLADHKNMLTDPEAFSQIMDLLNIYVQSGWPEALGLLWRLDEIFR